MKLWKQLALSAHYYGTYPYRSWRNRRAARDGRAPIMILTFHRIDDDQANDWTTSYAEFVRQIDWLARRFELISLEEAQRRIRGRANHRACVAITFDDGYYVNYERALPYLIIRRIPVTYFVCADAILKGAHFDHDLVMGNRFAPNTIEQLRTLAAAGIQIGAHTRTHANLGSVSDLEKLQDEVVTAGEDLQTALDAPIRYFAFPFGQHRHLSARAFRMADSAGYDGVCSAYGGYNYPGDDAFHLQRICTDGPLIRMKNWVTVDPLKQLQLRRFFYGPEIETPQLVGETVS